MEMIVLNWQEDLKKILRSKSKLSPVEFNKFIVQHINWSVTIIKDALGYEMLETFCAKCRNYNTCWKKLSVFETENLSGCICGEFFNPKAKYLDEALRHSMEKILQHTNTRAQLLKG
jgi:hypothetical protein